MKDNYETGTVSSSGCITTSSTGVYPYYKLVTGPYQTPIVSIPSVWTEPIPASIKNLYQSCASATGWGTLTATDAYTIDPTYWNWVQAPGHILPNNKKGDDDMRYLFEVILVNPKKDSFVVEIVIAKSETSALMKVYKLSSWEEVIDFDDLKTSCRVLMEWKKKESLKKAIETIKKAFEVK